MKNLTIEQQVEHYKALTVSRAGRNISRWLIGGAGFLAVLAAVFWHPVPLMCAIFLGVVGFASLKIVPNIQQAVYAYDTEMPTQGTATITISRWSDDDHTHVQIREDGQPDWAYEFRAQGWIPEEGTFTVRIWRKNDRPAPVLCASSTGLMIPMYDPKRL